MRNALSTAAAAAIVLGTGAVASASIAEFVPRPDGYSARDLVSDGTTGFEAPDFTLGPIGGQNGWGVSAFTDGSAAINADISNANPNSGAQHLRVTDHSGVADGTSTFAFSPPLASPTNYMSVDVNVSALGGSDYIIQPQSPSTGQLFTIVRFDFQGDILIADDPDGPGPGGAAYQDAGDYVAGTYYTFEIELNGTTIDYRLDGTTIYTGNVWAGPQIEEILLGSDNWGAGETGDFDNVSVVIPEPTSLAVLGLGGLTLLRRRRA